MSLISGLVPARDKLETIGYRCIQGADRHELSHKSKEFVMLENIRQVCLLDLTADFGYAYLRFS